MALQAFKNDPKMKTFVLSTLAVHREADKIKQGVYWENGKGCAVGCTLESIRIFLGQTSIEHSSHKLYEEYLGVPRILARLEDRIFEGLSNGTAKEWPERFVGAIRPGADLTGVWPLFAAWMLADPQDGVIRFCRTDEQRAIIQKVADTYRAGTASKANWVKIRDETWRIRNADAATYAADAATYAAAADAGRLKFYEKMADKLAELISAC